jgi:hypothetical protein
MLHVTKRNPWSCVQNLVSRIRNPLPFSGRGIPAGGVALRSHMSNIARSSRLAIRAPHPEN